MAWSTVELASIATASGSKAGERTSVPVYSVTKHRGFVPSADYFNKQVYSRDLSGYKFVGSGEFAYATIHLDEGSIGIAPVDALISPMYSVFAVDSSQVAPEYLVRFLKSPRALAEYPQLGTGSAERRKSIPFNRLGKLRIPLPPLPEQRRIAAILDHADALRAKRREALAHLNELTQSIFIDMFGDPVANPHRWDFGTLRSAGISLTSGLNVVATGGTEHPKNQVLKVSAVSGGDFRPGETKPLPVDYSPPEAHAVSDGDLLMTRASGTVDLICVAAEVRCVPEAVYLPDKIWKVLFHESSRIRPRYFQVMTMHSGFRMYIRNEASGASGVRNISQSKALSFTCALPPVDLQDQFTARFDRIELLRSQHCTALAELDAFFASLQSRAFRGEL